MGHKDYILRNKKSNNIKYWRWSEILTAEATKNEQNVWNYSNIFWQHKPSSGVKREKSEKLNLVTRRVKRPGDEVVRKSMFTCVRFVISALCRVYLYEEDIINALEFATEMSLASLSHWRTFAAYKFQPDEANIVNWVAR